jgi:hypothetical protein
VQNRLNQLTEAGSAPVTHDAGGNITVRDTQLQATASREYPE